MELRIARLEGVNEALEADLLVETAANNNLRVKVKDQRQEIVSLKQELVKIIDKYDHQKQVWDKALVELRDFRDAYVVTKLGLHTIQLLSSNLFSAFDRQAARFTRLYPHTDITTHHIAMGVTPDDLVSEKGDINRKGYYALVQGRPAYEWLPLYWDGSGSEHRPTPVQMTFPKVLGGQSSPLAEACYWGKTPYEYGETSRDVVNNWTTRLTSNITMLLAVAENVPLHVPPKFPPLPVNVFNPSQTSDAEGWEFVEH